MCQSSSYLQTIDMDKVLSFSRTLQETGQLEIKMTSAPHKIDMTTSGATVLEPIQKDVTGPIMVEKIEEIRGLCIKVKTADKDKLRFEFDKLFN